MANTYTQIYIHIVFAVEGRQSLIKPEHNDELQKYITGIVSAQKQKLITINNLPDHLHLLVGLKPDISLSDLVRDVKANSSKLINESVGLPEDFRGRKVLARFPIHVRSLAR
jgi:REP element-mobilizing transposase RayT